MIRLVSLTPELMVTTQKSDNADEEVKKPEAEISSEVK